MWSLRYSATITKSIYLIDVKAHTVWLHRGRYWREQSVGARSSDICLMLLPVLALVGRHVTSKMEHKTINTAVRYEKIIVYLRKKNDFSARY